jgi:DNA-binding NtrC family response regulator
MRVLYPTLHKAARGDFPVLLEGEAGVGKRLCAEQIHARSRRSHQRFVPVACRRVSVDELVELLFDGEKASGGTIFLDEVAALPAALQERILGALTPSPGESRFLFGTRKDLDREVTAGRFREDLVAALAATRIELPPLREREGDIELLARSFWDDLVAEAPDNGAAELPSDFLARTQDYGWPGNVRELSRAVYSRFCLGEFARLQADGAKSGGDDAFLAVLGRELRLPEARDIVVEDFERRYVAYMLERHGTTKDAAKASGVAQRYFQLLLARSRG